METTRNVKNRIKALYESVGRGFESLPSHQGLLHRFCAAVLFIILSNPSCKSSAVPYNRGCAPVCAGTVRMYRIKEKSMSSQTNTLTEGPLAKQIFLVSLPLALSNLLQVLFNMSDVAVVGRFAGSTALGAVGSTSTLVTLFTGFLIGLSNGINVLVARFYGARHPKDVEKTVHSAAIISAVAGVALLLIGLLGSLVAR